MDRITFDLPEHLLSGISQKKTITGYMYDTLTSTNDQAWQLSKQALESPFFVVAKQQTAGKGQRGNQWKSPLGGLYLSLYLNLELSTHSIHHLTLFSVYGLVSQLRVHQLPVQIKWLNDLIVEQKKLGGILCETKVSHNTIHQAVIGVGINYANSIQEGATNIRELFHNNKQLLTINSLSNLVNIVIIGLLNGYKQYQLRGIDFIVKKYNQFLHNYQAKILLKKNQGIILGVNQQGYLTIKLSAHRASAYMYLSPEKHHISYSKNQENYYILTQK